MYDKLILHYVFVLSQNKYIHISNVAIPLFSLTRTNHNSTPMVLTEFYVYFIHTWYNISIPCYHRGRLLHIVGVITVSLMLYYVPSFLFKWATYRNHQQQRWAVPIPESESRLELIHEKYFDKTRESILPP